jgi:hypothetical protein
MTKGATMIVTAALVLGTGGTALGEQLAGKGEWRSAKADGIRGTWTAELVRSGDEVRGQLILKGSNVFAGGEVSGSIDATSVMLGVMAEGNEVAIFTGKLDGGEVKGEWEAALVGDEGVWFGKLGDGR